MKNYITVISPIFNEEKENILNLINSISNVVKKITKNFKIILIDDGSKEYVWQNIRKLSKKKNLRAIRLEKNFGQHSAIKAGLDHTNSKYTVVIDGDLQENPSHIYDLYKKIIIGYDVVFAERIGREDITQNFFSKIFFFFINILGNNQFNNKIGNFSIFNEKILNKLKFNKFTHLSFFASINNISSKKSTIQVKRIARKIGKPKYTFFGRLKLAENVIINFSQRLLYLSSIFCFLFFLLLIFLIFYITINKINSPEGLIPGWSSLALISTFGFGITNLSIAIMCLYINSIHEIVKNNNSYSVIDYINFK